MIAQGAKGQVLSDLAAVTNGHAPVVDNFATSTCKISETWASSSLNHEQNFWPHVGRFL